MDTFSGSIRSAGRLITPRRFFYLAFFLGAAMFVAGCGKKNETPPVSTNAPAAQANQGGQAVAPPVSPSPAPNSSQPAPAAPAANASTTTPDLQSLNQQMIKWIVQTHQRPKNFEDFVTRANIQVPPPPAGKKYVIDKHGFITLVDSSTQ